MIQYKKFADYDAYVKKQGGKISFSLDKIKEKNSSRRIKFESIFKKVKNDFLKGNILCLGARTGCEVVAARNLGYKNSLGLDLYPVGDLVVEGDWHKMLFGPDRFDNAFCNSLDHCFDLPVLVQELKNVLKPNGIFYFMVMKKMALCTVEGSIPDRMASRAYDSMFWDTEQDIIDEFLSYGFELKKTWTDTKWFNCILRNIK